MENLLGGLRAAGEPTRLRLLALCAHAELTVTDMTQILGQSQPRVSRHLKLLCEAGLLDRFREATFAHYRLADRGDGAELARILVDLIPDDDETLSRDLERLEAIKATRAAAADDYFRANAQQWDRVRSLYVAEDQVEQALLELTADLPAERFLDIGTGTGRILQIFAPRCRLGVGVDLSRDMLQIARANLEAANAPHCQVRLGDMYGLPVQPGGFDLAVVHMVLHYADRPGEVIAEAARALKPGGALFLVDFAPHSQVSLRDEHRHRWLGFDESEISRWSLAAGLETRPSVRLAGDPLTVTIWSARRPGALEATDAAAASAHEG